MYDVPPAREHNAWYPENEAREHYAKDDDDRREAEARQKPVNPMPGDDEFAPAWVDYGAVRENYTRKHDKPVYDNLVDAGETDAYLPPEKGGRGKVNPMDAVAEADRKRGIRARFGDKRAESWIAEHRTMTDGTRFVVPHGKPYTRTLHGRPKYLRYFDDPTGMAALAELSATHNRNDYVNVEMSRGILRMWLHLHNLMVERGQLTDNGRGAIIASVIAGMKAGDVASMRVYNRGDLRWIAKRAPKRYKKGAFGEFLKFLAST